MKSLWRKIGFILAWVILALGLVGAIIAAAGAFLGFTGFCLIFVPALFFFTLIMIYLEHTNNIEMRIDQTYRKENGMAQLPESAYTNMPSFAAPAAPMYQQPGVMMQQPAAPMQPVAPAPAPVQQPAPVPTPAPAPVQQSAPAPAPVQEAQPWNCPNCGTQNNPNANFCKSCGSKKS